MPRPVIHCPELAPKTMTMDLVPSSYTPASMEPSVAIPLVGSLKTSTSKCLALGVTLKTSWATALEAVAGVAIGSTMTLHPTSEGVGVGSVLRRLREFQRREV
jgi:hypothetical protein